MGINIALRERKGFLPHHWFKGPVKPVNDNQKEAKHGDFRPLVGGGGWQALKAGIRERFDDMAAHPRHIRYLGTMEVERSKIGWMFAFICKLFGSPLAPYKGSDVPVAVNVFPVESGGVCWQRVYDFRHKGKVTVQSVKIVDEKRGLLECVGRGLGMRLRVFEKDGALHFKSAHYFLDILGFHLPIPLLITPGKIHVEQIDEPDGFFRFRLKFDHPWFGRTFFQDGVFIEEENSNE